MSQARGDLQEVVNRLGYRNTAAPLQQRSQILALDKFKGNEVKPLIFAAKKHPGNVLVVELGSGPRFLVETANAFRIGGHLGWQNLEGDCAVQLRVARPNDRRHATDADGLQELEMCQPPAAEHARQGIL